MQRVNDLRRSRHSLHAIQRKTVQAGVGMLRFLLLAGISYVILFPLLSKISASFMSGSDLFDQTVLWIPRNLTLANYQLVLEHMKYFEALINTLALSLAVACLQLVSCACVGYGFARFKFFGRNIWFVLVVFMLLVPPQLLMIPLYLNFRYFDLLGLLPSPGVNLLGSFWPFILMAATSTGPRNGLFIYIFRQFFAGMPGELEEAAYVDGAGSLKTFLSIMLPGAVPALVTVFLFAFVWQWNEFFLTGIFMRGAIILPITLEGLVDSLLRQLMIEAGGITTVITIQETSLLNSTGMLLFMAPLLLIYALLQRYFIESVERTGIVG